MDYPVLVNPGKSSQAVFSSKSSQASLLKQVFSRDVDEEENQGGRSGDGETP
jgi:hypothetical protein